MDSNILELQREISNELQFIANLLETRVENFVPMTTTQYGEVGEKLEELRKRVEQKAVQVTDIITDINSSVSYLRDESVRNEAKEVHEFNTVLELICKVESNLQMINLNSPAVVREAELLRDSTSSLSDITQLGRSVPLFEKVCNMLSKDLSYSRVCLLAKLSSECKEFISFLPCGVKTNSQMKIRSKSSTDVSETLTSLDILGQFKEQLAKWCTRIFSDFCEVIVISRNGSGVYEHSMSKNSEHMFSTTARQPNIPVDLSGVFKALTAFFTNLHDAIAEVEVGNDRRPLASFIGRSLQEQIMELLIKKCIAIAAPTADKNDPAFLNAMTEASAFRQAMIEMNFWNEAVPMFLQYAETNDTVFINSRCLAVLSEAKRLICEPFIELQQVGSDDEITEETREDYTNAFPNVSAGEIDSYDKGCPKFMQFLKCSVSKSTVLLVNLVEKTIEDALDAENEVLRARLLTTAQNILRLYNSIARTHHQKAISSVPQAAAVFFNNNYYICHKIVLMPFGVLKKVKSKKVQEASKDVYPILAENLWLLRESASSALEDMLANTRRQISSLLDDKNMFVGLDKMEESKNCDRTITACIDLVRSMHDVWNEVMSETVFCKSLGNIASFFLSDIIDKLLDAEDIRSKDAEAGALKLEKILTQLQKFFVIRGKTTIHTFCESAYFRTKEIIFCLNGSLQGISDRWCDGKGPLAQWMNASEVRGLIKALFMNTEQRKELLESIC